MKTKFSVILLLIALLLPACGGRDEDKATPIQFHRFEQELWQTVHDSLPNSQLEQHYSEWLPIYCAEVLAIDSTTCGNRLPYLQHFVQHKLVKQLYRDASQRISNELLTDIEHTLSSAFGRYRELLPRHQTPAIYTHISGLNHPIVVADSLISVSIDHYLGNDYPLYKERYYPYQILRKEPSFIPYDMVLAWLYSEFPERNNNHTLLDKMIYQGAIYYTMQQLFELKDIDSPLGYTAEQGDWCLSEEAQIWHKVVGEKMLYANDAFLAEKFVASAPFTAPISRESPPQLGCWLGWRIVSAYLDNSPHPIALEQLLRGEYSAATLLRESAYHF